MLTKLASLIAVSASSILASYICIYKCLTNHHRLRLRLFKLLPLTLPPSRLQVRQFVVSVNGLNVLDLDYRSVSHLILTGPRTLLMEVMEETEH